VDERRSLIPFVSKSRVSAKTVSPAQRLFARYIARSAARSTAVMPDCCALVALESRHAPMLADTDTGRSCTEVIAPSTE